MFKYVDLTINVQECLQEEMIINLNIRQETNINLIEKNSLKVKNLLLIHKELFFNSKWCNLILIKNIGEIIDLERVRAENKYKTMLVATVTHELRTPVTSIKYMLDFTENQTKDPQLLQNISVAKASCELFTNLINDILVLSTLLS